MNAIQQLEQIIKRGIDERAFPGANYCLYIKGKVFFGSLGAKEWYPTQIENNLDTIYDMASLTKVVATTTSMMQLLENGMIRLHDAVKKYLPRIPFDNITIWNLMTHTSGYPEGISGPKDKLTSLDVWEKIYAIDKLRYTPSTHIEYSDINYILLGKIIEILTNEPLQDYVQNHIFVPLEMKDTGYLPKDKNRCAATEYRDDATMKGYVKGDVHDETAYALDKVAGHAGLFSTVKDMSHFIEMILKGGVYNQKRILSKKSVDLLFKVQVKEYVGVETMPKARCLGWQTKDPYSSAGDFVSENIILHTGFTGTNVFIDRDNEVGFCMLTNRVHPLRGNGLHMHYRAVIANYILTHLEEF